MVHQWICNQHDNKMVQQWKCIAKELTSSHFEIVINCAESFYTVIIFRNGKLGKKGANHSFIMFKPVVGTVEHYVSSGKRLVTCFCSHNVSAPFCCQILYTVKSSTIHNTS